MDWLTEARFAMASFLEHHGLLAAFVLILIEEAGVPVPVPGDIFMLLLGVQAKQGHIQLWQALLVMELATLIGASFLYMVARAAGRPLVYRYGRFIRLDPNRLDQAEGWLTRHGWRAILVGRLIPGLRILTTIACGVLAVPRRTFLLATGVGAFIYIAVYTLLGYFIGPPVVQLLEGLHLPFSLIGSLLVLIALVVWTIRARLAIGGRALAASVQQAGRNQRLRAGALAGGLATIGSTLLLNALVNVAGDLAFRAPGTFVERTAARLALGVAHDLQPWMLVVAVPAYLLVGVGWGALYAAWVRPRLPVHDAVAGLVFAVVPLAVSVVVVMPVLGLVTYPLDVTGQVALAGEAIRHAAYGLLLGLIYPVLTYQRPEDASLPSASTERAPALEST
jgi:membrane protein DedA with SNARE-associated domain